jgi:ketosteroid isomerase-like protein
MSTLSDTDEQVIRHKLEVDWPDCTIRQDWDGSLALVSEDFVYMPQDHAVLKGKPETRAFLEGFPPLLRMTQSMEALSGSTELAVARGTFEAAMEIDGTLVSGKGKWICTATHRDGDWLFTSSCFNWDGPPEAGG